MRSLFQDKRWILFISFLALGALTVLAIGLRDVSFSEAQPFGRREAARAADLPTRSYRGPTGGFASIPDPFLGINASSDCANRCIGLS